MIQNWKIKKDDFLFFTAYMVFLLYKILGTSTFKEVLGSSIISYIKVFSWILFIVKILVCNKKNPKSIIIYFMLMTLSIIIRIYSGSSEIFELFLVIIAASDIEFNNIAKVTLIETLILCGIIIASGLLGIVTNYTFPRANGKYSMALGFSYVSKLSNYVLQIIFLSLYLHENKNKNVSGLKLILYFIICTSVFFIQYVRNSYYLSLMLLFLYIIVIKYKKIKFRKFKNILSFMFIICFLVIFFLVNNFNKDIDIYNKLDKSLNTRLSVMNRVCKDYKINKFGNKIEMNGFGVINEKYTYVDSGYISLLLRDGYVVIILIGILYTYLIRYNINKDNNILVIWLILMAISAMIDDTLIQINFNCSILILLEPINNIIKDKRKEIKENENSNSNSYI